MVYKGTQTQKEGSRGLLWVLEVQSLLHQVARSGLRLADIGNGAMWAVL